MPRIFKPLEAGCLQVNLMSTSAQINQLKYTTILYKLAGFQSFQETFFIKMDLSRGHFYNTIEEAKTAIKRYSKLHYFIRLIRPRRIKNILFVGNRPRR